MRVMGRRSETRDGLWNRLQFFFLTHGRRRSGLSVQAIGFLRSFVNRRLINRAICKTQDPALRTQHEVPLHLVGFVDRPDV